MKNAQIALSQARPDAYNAYVADAALLSAVGRLEVGAIAKGISRYDPLTNFPKASHHGSVPWEFIPSYLDRIGAPRADRPDAKVTAEQPHIR